MQKVEKLIFSLRREKKFKGYLLVRRYISTISIEEKKRNDKSEPQLRQQERQ